MEENKRRYIRYQVVADIDIFAPKSDYFGYLYDISLGGANFVTSARLNVGELCGINVKKLHRLHLIKEALIRWSRPVENSDNNMTTYGIEFLDYLSKDQLTEVVDQFHI